MAYFISPRQQGDSYSAGVAAPFWIDFAKVKHYLL